MEKPRQYYPVVFKHDNEVLLETHGFIEETKGEPYDTARVYSTAVQELRKAVRAGAAPKDAFERGNLTVITYPDGQAKSYTDEQMGKLLDEHSELNKYKPTKNSRVIVTVEGGFTGELMKGTDVTLDKLSDDDFKRVTEILDLLQTRGAKLDYTGMIGNFGYFVKVGDHDANPNDMKFAFRGGSFSKMPVVVEELEDILSKYVERDTKRRGFDGRY